MGFSIIVNPLWTNNAFHGGKMFIFTVVVCGVDTQMDDEVEKDEQMIVLKQ